MRPVSLQKPGTQRQSHGEEGNKKSEVGAEKARPRLRTSPDTRQGWPAPKDLPLKAQCGIQEKSHAPSECSGLCGPVYSSTERRHRQTGDTHQEEVKNPNEGLMKSSKGARHALPKCHGVTELPALRPMELTPHLLGPLLLTRTQRRHALESGQMMPAVPRPKAACRNGCARSVARVSPSGARLCTAEERRNRTTLRSGESLLLWATRL